MSELLFKDNCKVAIFKAPETDDYRKVVIDYMKKMSEITWTPKETFAIKWKGEPRFKIELVYEKGKTYHGMTYTDTKGSLDLFELLLEDGVLTPNSEFYEECFGNHCSASMDMAYQQILDFPYQGTVKPNDQRGTMLVLANGLKQPTQYGRGYDSFDVWDINSKEDVLEAFANLDAGDVLYYCNKKKSGHARMVSKKSDVVRFPSGDIDPENSYVYTTEQTNKFDTPEYAGEKNTTWYVDHKYSFATLYEKHFMPVTFTIFTSGEKSKDAFIIYEGNNNAQTIKDGLNGNVTSSFPLTYVRVTVKDKEGKLVAHSIKYNLSKCYYAELSELTEALKLDTLPEGTYTMNIRAGIARGGKDFETFEFTV